MVKLTKIYTKTGDDGTTGLAGGKRIKKSSLRIKAFGVLDELNTQLGCAISLLPATPTLQPILQSTQYIQQQCFNIGAQWCIAKEDQRENSPDLPADAITTLEAEIDHYNNQLPTLQSFILPGGHTAASAYQMARCICRRVEHTSHCLNEEEPNTLNTTHLIYLNRLSDWLFVVARYINQQLDITEPLWIPSTPKHEDLS